MKKLLLLFALSPFLFSQAMACHCPHHQCGKKYKALQEFSIQDKDEVSHSIKTDAIFFVISPNNSHPEYYKVALSKEDHFLTTGKEIESHIDNQDMKEIQKKH